MKRISQLHFITTDAATAEKACRGGVDWVQLRLKNVSYEAYRAEALKVQAVCRQYGATFIVNDNVQLAKEIGADGVHIGKEDMDPAAARALLGDSFMIGCTANTYKDVVRLSALPIDYIGLGPYRFTATKEKLSPVLGLDGYRQIREQLKAASIACPPIVAIGGILLYDVPLLFNAGMNGIAVSGVIHNAADVTGKAKEFTEAIKKPVATPPSTVGFGDVVLATDAIGTIVDGILGGN